MWRLIVLALINTATAQIPLLGWCPNYQPMANFSLNKYLGTWYEGERYFSVNELGSRCVTTRYESTPEGRILVSNEITNSLTGVKRVIEGHLQKIGREGEGLLVVKYSSLPIPYDNVYSVLDTDYNNYAVVWSCSGIGPVHTQNAWIMTRKRLAPASVMQSAYGVLDKFKISRTFFVKTNQADCQVLPDPAADPIESKSTDDMVIPDCIKKLNTEGATDIPEEVIPDDMYNPLKIINKMSEQGKKDEKAETVEETSEKVDASIIEAKETEKDKPSK